MSTSLDNLDIYQRFELEIRKPRKQLLLDAFLPPAESLPSTVAPPPPPPLPAVSEEEANLFSRLDAREEPEPEQKPRRKPTKGGKARKKTESGRQMTLQEEIDEFMSSDRHALVPDEDPEKS